MVAQDFWWHAGLLARLAQRCSPQSALFARRPFTSLWTVPSASSPHRDHHVARGSRRLRGRFARHTHVVRLDTNTGACAKPQSPIWGIAPGLFFPRIFFASYEWKRSRARQSTAKRHEDSGNPPQSAHLLTAGPLAIPLSFHAICSSVVPRHSSERKETSAWVSIPLFSCVERRRRRCSVSK